MHDSSPAFSVIIPIYNEEENIPELYRRLTTVMERLCSDSGFSIDGYEIILVDDGSTDRSWQLIKELHVKDQRVKGISFSRNFGHHIAITAGLDYSRGEAVILMDGDLQDPPEEISRLYAAFSGRYDLVYGIRQQRQDPVVQESCFLPLLVGVEKVFRYRYPQGTDNVEDYEQKARRHNKRDERILAIYPWDNGMGRFSCYNVRGFT